MFVIEGERPFILIPTPKTGSNSMRTYLRKFELFHLHGTHGFDAQYIAAAKDPVILATTRHPQAVIVSWYKYKYGPKGMNFDATVGKMLTRKFTGYVRKGVRIFYWTETQPKVLRLEDGLKEPIDNALRECGLEPPDGEFPWVNDTHDRTPWPEFYTPRLAEQVYNEWHVDFDEFGYEMGYAGQ